MRLGTRWGAGTPPHPSVPSALHEAIATQEARFPEAASWTLTWLEGRPRCELDGEVLVSLDPAGRVVVSAPPRAGEPGATGPTAGGPGAAEWEDDDSDDDWLT
ncbi:Fe-S oxidoreductase [Leucobacter sp. CSA1]|uniref:Fe-S oxidoreductase n=1 Tax=Leucobacter chromiisoli TaxID=2796471 RepID=A0A934Q7L3_9MICO|nr:Fe-S oxidoreductase [Leucobacter chromiisoli]MBK0418027.1 Fe-S oxidoreductase [Leucobacter chromiisoli]